ncbi:LTA synthase family protein [Paenibacillus sanfengchensis]|uniref:LTA synthase family protein n=2 Tax=Paenibacillus TaxID=44249 RepID=UPI002FE026A3
MNQHKSLDLGGGHAFFGTGKNCNLIMVQMESLQNFMLYASIQEQPVTPVLNRLAGESLYFPYIFQQIGSGNTSDAEFLSNTSIYPIGAKAMSEAFGDRIIPSLPRLLKSSGYTTRTFHVNEASFWNRDKLYPSLGFDQYYDKPYFSQTKFNRFGASDEELFRVGIQKIKAFRDRGQKFYTQFVTVSSHAPFVIPKEMKRIKLTEDLDKSRLGDYIHAINYADYALGTFIDELKKSGIWDKSVVVVYGDHFGLNKNQHTPENISKLLALPYHDPISRLNVPLIIHLPGQQQGWVIERTGGHVDILPTVANLMGIDLEQRNFTAFGQDLLNVEHNLVGVRYYLPEGSFFKDDVLFIPGKNGFRDGRAVSLQTFHDIQDTASLREDYESVLRLLKQSDSFVKKLPRRGENIAIHRTP